MDGMSRMCGSNLLHDALRRCVGWQIVAETTQVRMRDKGMLTAAGCFDIFFSNRLPPGII
jgi:hypothetical protein